MATILKMTSRIIKLIDRIAFITFWINIFVVIFIFIGMPILIINKPDFIDPWITNKGINPFNMIMTVLYLAVFFHWWYCICFLFKYDRYSKSIIPLFFFNALYAPIYYYRVKIKKRPLRNKINKPQTDSEDKSISDEEFVDLTRKNVFGVIDLWASKDIQLDYQKNVPIVHVSVELFCQWADFYFPDSDDFKQSFSDLELKLLAEFNAEFIRITDKTPKDLPIIEEFIDTEEWKNLNKKAIEIRNKINTVAPKG